MDQAVAAVLAEYDARAAVEETLRRKTPPQDMASRLDDWLLPVGPATGSFINLVVKEAGARSILEIGSSYGYSTVWLAEAARATGGRVTTLEIHPGKVAYAASRLALAGLDRFVEFHPGDARQTLAKLSGPFEFVLLDLWKDLYIPCFDLFHPKLAPGAVVVADNMLSPEAALPAVARYRRHLRSASGMSSVLLSIGMGIEVSRFKADP